MQRAINFLFGFIFSSVYTHVIRMKSVVSHGEDVKPVIFEGECRKLHSVVHYFSYGGHERDHALKPRQGNPAVPDVAASFVGFKISDSLASDHNPVSAKDAIFADKECFGVSLCCFFLYSLSLSPPYFHEEKKLVISLQQIKYFFEPDVFSFFYAA